MGMIVLHHLLVHGLALKASFVQDVKLDGFLFSCIVLNAFTVFAVNAFVLISGYFGIRYKTRSLFYLIMQGLVYAGCLMLVFRWMGYAGGGVLPTKYWFLLCFVCMYLLAPYVNLVIDGINDKGVLVLVAIVGFLQFFVGYLTEHAIVGGGYSVQQLLAMYVYGRALNRFEFWREKIDWKLLLLVFVCCWLLIAGAAIYLLVTSHSRWAWRMYSYDSPLVVLGAVCVFLLSLKVTIQISWVRSVSKHIFGVYLFHDNEYFSKYVIAACVPVFVVNFGGVFVFLPVMVVGLLVVGIVVDMIFSWGLNVLLAHPFVERVFDRLDSTVIPNQQKTQTRD